MYQAMRNILSRYLPIFKLFNHTVPVSLKRRLTSLTMDFSSRYFKIGPIAWDADSLTGAIT